MASFPVSRTRLFLRSIPAIRIITRIGPNIARFPMALKNLAIEVIFLALTISTAYVSNCRLAKIRRIGAIIIEGRSKCCLLKQGPQGGYDQS